LNILFRTSGGRATSKELGFGHIFRSLNLAKFLSDQRIFFLIEDYGGVKPLFKKYDSHTIFIKKNLDVKSDILQTIDMILKKQIDVVVVDKFNTSKIFLKKIQKFSKVVYISDLNKINYPCDLLVNGYVGFKNNKSKNNYGSTCLLGPSYQILHPNFSESLKIKKKYDFLITFGGFDERKIIQNILEELVKLPRSYRIKLILGPGTIISPSILNFTKQNHKGIVITQKTNNMHKDISLSKYGICSGGLTTYEFASQHVPFTIICQARHQLDTAKEWEKLGIAKNLGLMNKKTKKHIIEFLKTNIDGNTFLSKKIFLDGLGGRRVSQEIKRLKK